MRAMTPEHSVDPTTLRVSDAERDLPVREEATDAGTVELRGWFDSIKRRGNWQVPHTLVLKRRLGSVKLDFTEARIEHDRVTIKLDVVGGSVEIRLPEGASASVDGVVATMGSVEDHRKDAAPAGRPHFELAGKVLLGSVELRGPRRKLLG